jgi:hypothetical protein
MREHDGKEREHDGKDRGFVLITTLVILMILTILLLGLYFRGKVNIDTSMSSRDSTKGFYLAEAGLNYLTWALYTDPNNPAADNNMDLDDDGIPDNTALIDNPDQYANKTVKYFDTNDTIGYNPQSPIKVNLATLAIPAHVALNITLNANNQASVSPVTFGTGTALPTDNGAVVWITSAVDDPTGTFPLNEKDTTGPASTKNVYAIYAYSIGYVHGKPIRMLRAKIGVASNFFAANLGAMTNGYQ